jgi:hypothetical protein
VHPGSGNGNGNRRDCPGASECSHCVVAGLVYALYGPSIYIDTSFLSESVLLFLIMLAVFALCREALTTTRVTAAGAAFGAAMLVRPTALAFAVACALDDHLRPPGAKTRI